MADPLLEVKNQQLKVKVRNRTATLFEGSVKAITSINDTGVFDVLPRHANFISMIQNFVTLILPNGKTQKFEIKSGVLSVSADTVDVYLTV